VKKEGGGRGNNKNSLCVQFKIWGGETSGARLYSVPPPWKRRKKAIAVISFEVVREKRHPSAQLPSSGGDEEEGKKESAERRAYASANL